MHFDAVPFGTKSYWKEAFIPQTITLGVMQSRRSSSPLSVYSHRNSKSPLSSREFRERKIGLPGADLREIEINIADELRRVKFHPDYSRQECYMVYKHAFDQLIESKAVVYKSILSQIKAEYEEFIETLERGESQTVYLQGMLKALLSEKANVRHFVQRGDELEEKMAKLKKHNTQLRQKLNTIRAERARRIASAESKSMHSVVKETRLLIPGLSLSDLTDISSLKKTLIRLEAQVKELKEATTTKFAEKGQKQILKQQLAKKENGRDHEFTNHEKLQDRCETLKVAIEVRLEGAPITPPPPHSNTINAKLERMDGGMGVRLWPDHLIQAQSLRASAQVLHSWALWMAKRVINNIKKTVMLRKYAC